jgi:hypothetical protein
MRIVVVPALVVAALAVAACDAGSKPADQGSPGPLLHFVSPRMDAVYEMQTVKETKDGKEVEVQAPPKLEVLFDLQNYVVGKDEAGKGQHIHLIVDNEPYQAVYDVTKGVALDPKLLTKGTHILRAFPSAGPKDDKGALHHESRKNDGAFAWVRFHVGAKGGNLADEFDATKPLLTYSRPKGEYVVGSPELAKFMVDWYLTNVTLSKQGNHVAVTLDGNKVGDYAEWKPVVLEKSPEVGDHVIKVELLDRDDKAISGPFNATERKFKVSEKK